MQFLEGPREHVCALLEKIRQDPRHHRVITVLQQEHAQREFSGWSMGFRELGANQTAEIPGYGEFVDLPLTSEQFLLDPSKSLRLLLNFKP